MSKQALRQQIRCLRESMSPSEVHRRSRQLCRLVLSSEPYQAAKTIYAYLPFQKEVQLLPLLQQALSDGKQVALPKCCGEEMNFILMSDLSQIQFTAFGVPEPVADGPVAQDPWALVLVPGVVFDRRGYRIGYGGGYYDRFLAREPKHPTIALCYDFQVLPQLEADAHDIPVDTIFAI